MSRNSADESAGAEPILWLHLSDLHLGCRGEALWAQVQEEFERSVREHVAELGMPDLILFTGDLTNRGSEAEFRQVDAFPGRIRVRGGSGSGLPFCLLAK